MKKLPKPKHELGYPKSQVEEIIKKLGISKKDFNRAFGINTYAISKSGETIMYVCDIERALFKLRCKLGKNHLWD
jgi:predicted RNA-binding protein (virulence factor B family)